MARIEYRRAILAAQAVRVLCELIAAGAANGTAVIHRSGPGIAEEAGEAGRKTLVQFNSQTVVVSGTRAHETPKPVRTDHLSVGLQAIPTRGAKLFLSVLINRSPIRPSRVTWTLGLVKRKL